MFSPANGTDLTRTVLRYLYPASLVYLALPLVIFFAGFLRWDLALFMLFVLIPAVIYSMMENTPESDPDSDIKPCQVVIVFVAAFMMMLISGAGCCGPQAGDWGKHNAVLTDLIQHSWPLYYKFEYTNEIYDFYANIKTPIVYYIGYYLPAALVGKMIGYNYGHIFLFLWTYVGLCIVLLWFAILVKRSTLLVIIVFFGFAGIDCIGHLYIRLFYHQPIGNVFRWGLIEWWAGYWQYSSHISLLYYVPHQSIAGWIATGLVMYEFLYSNFKKNIILYIALISLWSPFALVGLAPFFLADMVISRRRFVKSLLNCVTLTNLCGFLCLCVMVLYYLSKLDHKGTDTNLIFLYPLVIDNPKYVIYSHLIMFIVLEFGLCSVLIRMSGLKMNDKEKKLFGAAVFTLLALPLFKYGVFNDFVMRVSIPSLFILCVFLVKALHGKPPKIIKTALFIIFFLGSVGPMLEVKDRVLYLYKSKQLWNIYVAPNLYEMTCYNDKLNLFSQQYIGSDDSIFFKYLAKKESYTPCIYTRKQSE